MCGIEEGEDGFCENGDENMYFESVDILDLKDIGVNLLNKEVVESFLEDLLVEKISYSFVDSKYENMYYENVDILDLKGIGVNLLNKDDVEIFLEDFLVEILSSEDDKSLLEVSDK